MPNRGRETFCSSSPPPAQLQMPLELRPQLDTEKPDNGGTWDRSTINPNVDASDVLSRPGVKRKTRRKPRKVPLDPPPRSDTKKLNRGD